SALSFATQMRVDLVSGGGGAPVAKGQPFYRHPRKLGPLISHPLDVRLPPSERAVRALGFYREGLGERSPFYGFLAYWKALEVVVGDEARTIETWIDDHARDDEKGLGQELRDRCRDAAAHGE